MNYYKTHSFKARPVNSSAMKSVGDKGVPKVAKSNLTEPSPFKFHSSAKKAARPTACPQTPDEVELKKKFRARPVPSSASSSVRSSASKSRRSLTTPVSPTFATMKRFGKKVTISGVKRTPQSSAKKLNASKGMINSTPTKVIPFKLSCDLRSEMSKAQTESARKKEEDKIAKMSSSFKAKPVPDFSRLSMTPKQSVKELTDPSPFKLQSEIRGEMARQILDVKKEEDEIKKLIAMSSFKANPVPKSTYVPTSSKELDTSICSTSSVSSRTPLKAFSPQLATKTQAKARSEFNKMDGERRAMSAKKAETVKQEERENEEAEIKERRSLPVSEGGMIPVALDINETIASVMDKENLDTEMVSPKPVRQTRSMVSAMR